VAQWGEEERMKAKRGFKLDLPMTPSPSNTEAPITKPPRRKQQHKQGKTLILSSFSSFKSYKTVLINV
jgi:hypothetical protein